LYGTTFSGSGASPCGAIYHVSPAGVYAAVYSFVDNFGCNPQEQPIQGTNGLLYGLTTTGGALGRGVFYSLGIHLPAFAGLVSPAGKSGGQLGILGQGFDSTSVVTFGGGVNATSITLEGSTFISATIPAGAVTGKVTVTTGSTTLSSIQNFKVLL
jgi:hypothetical protein